jgi:hypothetical protein
MNRILVPAVLLFLISFATTEAMAMAQEEFGNKPLQTEDGTPGTLRLLNDVHRVYAFWCMNMKKGHL